ncbi:LysR family transcriptional regulator [Ensifer sp. ENS05]|uniref:LysR family transcriptional regulator n=1 Tax=Ensifer sp. ENS05 TaxID=2769277 RepID=UPI00177D8FC2|nr:LysR family transcriptional regulator [Ensifer sp. ENS05]MBD9597302.1 LysR family transcriptional regulator [Ensifer sp. ENS05]
MRLHYDLVDLDLFINVARWGNLTRGAAASNISPGPASMRIRKLEAALNVTLFERCSKGVTLTSAGSQLLCRATSVLAQLKSIDKGLQPTIAEARQRVKVSTTTFATNGSLLSAIDSFLQHSPDVDVDVDVGQASEILLALRRKEIEIAVLCPNASTEGLVSLPYQCDPLLVAVSVDHPLSSGSSLSFLDLVDQEFLSLSGESANYAFFRKVAVEVNRPLKVRMRVSTVAQLLDMVGRGMGVAVLPASVVAKAKGRSDLRFVALTDRWAEREVRILVDDPDQMSPAGHRLLTALCEYRERHHPSH